MGFGGGEVMGVTGGLRGLVFIKLSLSVDLNPAITPSYYYHHC